MKRLNLTQLQFRILRELSERGAVVWQEWQQWNQVPIYWLHQRKLVYLRNDLALKASALGRQAYAEHITDPKQRIDYTRPTFDHWKLPRRRRAARVARSSF